MDFSKIIIGSNQRIADIFEGIQKETNKTILLIFPTHYPPLLEKTFTKKLKKYALDADKDLIIVSHKKMVRDFLKKSGFAAYSIVPAKYKNADTKNLFEILSTNPKAEDLDKDETKTDLEDEDKKNIKTEKSSIDIPNFSLKKIQKNKSPIRAKVFFYFLFFLLSFLILFYWQSPTAHIVLRPRISVVPVLQNMILKLPETEVDQTEQTLPIIKSILLDTVITDKEIISTSGREYEVTNAKGKITLFNETDTPKFLVPSRLKTSNGLIFRFNANITIPAKANGKAGRITVSIEADELDENGDPIGIKGNIEAGTEFIFPALRDDLQELYYGKAVNGPLVGGSTLTKYKVAEADKEIAKKVLLENFRDRALQQLEIQLKNRQLNQGESHVFLQNNNFIFEELLSFEFPEELIGTESQTVTVNGSVKVAGLIFDQKSVTSALEKQLAKNIDERQKIIGIDEKSIEYTPFDVKDFKENKWGKVSVKALATEQFSVDSNNPLFQDWIRQIKNDITNKSKEEIKPILANNQEIEEVVSVSIKPFWATKTPLSPNRIFFKIQPVE